MQTNPGKQICLRLLYSKKKESESFPQKYGVAIRKAHAHNMVFVSFIFQNSTVHYMEHRTILDLRLIYSPLYILMDLLGEF